VARPDIKVTKVLSVSKIIYYRGADRNWRMEMTRRNKLEILGSILDLCKTDGSSKTKIVYQVNLNFKNAGLYLEWLTSHEYLVKEDRLYKTTPTGRELLNNINNINSTINDRLESVPDRNEK
jgi:predicted transcriptional regulator